MNKRKFDECYKNDIGNPDSYLLSPQFMNILASTKNKVLDPFKYSYDAKINNTTISEIIEAYLRYSNESNIAEQTFDYEFLVVFFTDFFRYFFKIADSNKNLNDIEYHQITSDVMKITFETISNKDHYYDNFIGEVFIPNMEKEEYFDMFINYVFEISLIYTFFHWSLYEDESKNVNGDEEMGVTLTDKNEMSLCNYENLKVFSDKETNRADFNLNLFNKLSGPIKTKIALVNFIKKFISNKFTNPI